MVRQYVKKSLISAMRRLPESVQLRLVSYVAASLGAAPALRILMKNASAADCALLVQERAGAASKSAIEAAAAILELLPSAERAALSQRLPVGRDTQTSAIPRRSFADLSRPENVATFQDLATILDVPAAEVSGRNGLLMGYLQDEGIFLPYLRDRTWFWNGIALIDGFFAGQSEGTFLDIGANIGAVVVPIAKANPLVDCFAFEPEPRNFIALTHNIARNGVGQNVEAYEMALAETDGAVTFELALSNFGDHRLRKAGSGGIPMFDEDARATIEVAAQSLCRALAGRELARPIIAKMDVQGAELMVLAGGESILRETELLVVEYWPYGMRRLGSDPAQFLTAFSAIFPLVARISEQAVSASDFVPFPALRAELEAFGRNDAMHLNLALAKRPIE